MRRNIQPNGMTQATLGLMYSDLTQPPVYIQGSLSNGIMVRAAADASRLEHPPNLTDKMDYHAPLNLTFTGQQSDLLYAPSTNETMLIVLQNEIRVSQMIATCRSL
jgi:hypothetical protein